MISSVREPQLMQRHTYASSISSHIHSLITNPLHFEHSMCRLPLMCTTTMIVEATVPGKNENEIRARLEFSHEAGMIAGLAKKTV
jgi:hypothetical protein